MRPLVLFWVVFSVCVWLVGILFGMSKGCQIVFGVEMLMGICVRVVCCVRKQHVIVKYCVRVT